MINWVKNFLLENNIKNKTVLAAVSGGADSSVLLHILNLIKDEFNLDIKVVHLNHNWRGEESDGDLKFTKALAEKYNFEFFSKTLEDDIKKTELDARVARYAFFEEALKKYKADVCFLAHNKNDNVETLIYRIIKGTGISGLSSIPPVRKPYFRPLLNFSRLEVENFANLNRLEFRTDSSNGDSKYKRNFIRKNIIPQMEKINPTALNAINSLINLANENNEILDDYIKSIEEKIFVKGSETFSINRPEIRRDAFLKLTPALQREILSRYFKGILKSRDYKTILRIQKFILDNENSTLSINSDTFLKTKNGTAFLFKRI